MLLGVLVYDDLGLVETNSFLAFLFHVELSRICNKYYYWNDTGYDY